MEHTIEPQKMILFCMLTFIALGLAIPNKQSENSLLHRGRISHANFNQQRISKPGYFSNSNLESVSFHRKKNITPKDTVYFMFCCQRHDTKYSNPLLGIRVVCNYCNYDFKYKMLSYDIVFKRKSDSVIFTITNQTFFPIRILNFYRENFKNYDELYAKNFKIRILGNHHPYVDKRRFGIVLSSIK
jgi:hypothetical protein